jgi:hypothetical protein
MEEPKKIKAELSELARQQIKAVKDATFLGWEASEGAAYDERAKRILLLRARLTALDPTIQYLT